MRRWARVLVMPLAILAAGLWIMQHQRDASRADAVRVRVEVQDMIERALRTGDCGPVLEATDPLLRSSVAARVLQLGAGAPVQEGARVVVRVVDGDALGLGTPATHTAVAGVCGGTPVGLAVVVARGEGSAAVVGVFEPDAQAAALWRAECEVAASTVPPR